MEKSKLRFLQDFVILRSDRSERFFFIFFFRRFIWSRLWGLCKNVCYVVVVSRIDVSLYHRPSWVELVIMVKTGFLRVSSPATQKLLKKISHWLEMKIKFDFFFVFWLSVERDELEVSTKDETFLSCKYWASFIEELDGIYQCDSNRRHLKFLFDELSVFSRNVDDVFMILNDIDDVSWLLSAPQL